MGLGNFASSLSKIGVHTQTAAPTSANNDSVAYSINRQGKGQTTINLPGSSTLGANASLTTVNYVTDFGVLGQVIESQGNLALANASLLGNSINRLSELAETKVTDGANLNQKTTQVGIVAFAVMGVVAGLLFFLFKR